MILMKQKNFDSDVIPAEQVVLLEKHILEELKKLRADSVEEMKNVRTESERKSKLLAEYQATPMEVVEIDSLWDIINPDTIVRNFDERLRPLKESDKSMAALLNKIDNRTGRIDNGLDNQYSLIEGLDSYITKPSRRRRFFEFVWKNRYNVIYDVAVALLSLFAILWTLYESRWSDDAWARRAYDAAVILEFKDKEIVYHRVRQDFANGKAKSNKHRIRELEAEVKELEMAGADGDDVDDGGSH